MIAKNGDDVLERRGKAERRKRRRRNEVKRGFGLSTYPSQLGFEWMTNESSLVTCRSMRRVLA